MRRSLLRRALAAVAVLAVTAFGAPAHAAALFHGPYWTDIDAGTHFGVAVYDGSSSHCGPDQLGEGWYCTDDYVDTRVDYTAYVDCGSCTSMTVELRLWNGTSSTVLSSYALTCSSDLCYRSYRPYPGPYWSHTWQGRLGGVLQGRVVSHWTDAFGVPQTRDSGAVSLGLSIDPVLRSSEIVNAGPYALPLLRPSHRITPEDVESLDFLLYDQEGHNVNETDVAVYAPDGALVAGYTLPKSKSLPPNGIANGVSATPPFVMPHQNGVYTIRTHAMDASGTATAWGPVRDDPFTYIWNTAPDVPVQLSPKDGEKATAGAPIAFTVQTSDPEGDAYTPVVTVTGASGTFTATGVPTASGEQGVAVLTGLPPGTYTWTAAATDSNGWTSAPSASRGLLVVALP